MPKSKQQKESDLKELVEKVKTAKAVVLSDYRGTTVKNMDTLRKTLRKEQVFSKVYKLTLLKKALEQNGLKAEVDFKQPVIFASSSEDETTPARLIKNLSKDIKTLNILSGIIEGKVVSREEVLAFAALPGKQELRAKLVGTLQAPISGLVNVLAGNLRALFNVLNAMAQKS